VYLLDTHIFFWWSVEPGKLSRKHNRLLTKGSAAGEPVALARITLWELAMLVERRRIEAPLPLDVWLDEIERTPEIELLTLTSAIAFDSVGLDSSFPKDPADRIIAATARCRGLTLMTADENIVESGLVRTA